MSSKRSTRVSSSSSSVDDADGDVLKVVVATEEEEDDQKKTRRRSAPAKTKGKATTAAAVADDLIPSKKIIKRKKSPAMEVAAVAASADTVDATTGATAASGTTKKKKSAVAHQQWTERTPLVRLWEPTMVATKEDDTIRRPFTIVSWNVAGLRALVKNRPEALPDLCQRTHADVVCLQETKLQRENMDDKKFKLREYFDDKMGEYDCHWSYSVEKKGYSGTAMFIRKADGDRKGKKQATLGAFFGSAKESPPDGGGNDAVPAKAHFSCSPINVETEPGLGPAHDGEGRTITAEFQLFYLTNVYVPNSGQNLDRLDYRTKKWDMDFLAKMQQLEKEGKKPVIWLGDLNVAHNEKDTWNEGAKHLAKSAGTTAEERASFEVQLGAGYVDAFRQLHPDGRGHYSYWSQRAGNREPNKGLRLDYFVCSRSLMEDGNGKKVVVRDSYMVPDVLGSDHCPIVLEMEIRK